MKANRVAPISRRPPIARFESESSTRPNLPKPLVLVNDDLEVEVYLCFPVATFGSRTDVCLDIHKLSCFLFHKEPILFGHNTGKFCPIPSLGFQLS
jgi:hypothetical protein